MARANLNPRPSSTHKHFEKAYVELHIEQGPILEHERVSIGVVESIVGIGSLLIEVHGEAGHAGTIPLKLRHDALACASKIVLGVNKIACETGENAVATVGSLIVTPGASNVVPGKVIMSVDFRDVTVRRMKLLQNKITTLARSVGRREDLKIKVILKNFTKPASMSPMVVRTIEASAQNLRLSFKRMQSGAGHDCQNLAQITQTGMIFVPSHRGLSHVPTERTEPKQLEAGANVLLQTLLRLAEYANP